jgi:two-component system LytT family response regulator
VYKAIAIDDDPLALLILKKFCSTCKCLNLIETHTKAEDGVRSIIEKKPEIVFLDMEMPDISGLDILKSLGESQKFIVISSNLDLREDALGLNAKAFLHKPASFCDFQHAVDQVTDCIRALSA